jgi:hypothetical protein
MKFECVNKVVKINCVSYIELSGKKQFKITDTNKDMSTRLPFQYSWSFHPWSITNAERYEKLDFVH